MAVVVVPYGLVLRKAARLVKPHDLLLTGRDVWRVERIIWFAPGWVKFETMAVLRSTYETPVALTRTAEHDQVIDLLRPYGDFFHDRTLSGAGGTSPHARTRRI